MVGLIFQFSSSAFIVSKRFSQPPWLALVSFMLEISLVV